MKTLYIPLSGIKCGAGSETGGIENAVCADLAQLRREFWAAARRLLAKPGVLRSCIKVVGYV